MTTTKIPVEFLNALSGSEITDGSIGTADIADDAITTAKIAANAITATELPDNVITATHIPNGLITGTHMAGTTITATQIANNAVGTDQLAGIARGKIIYGDSNGDPQLLTIGSNGTALVSDGTDISWGSAGETNRLPLAGGTMTGNIAHAGTFAIDVGGEIHLDADGGIIRIRDDGGDIGMLQMTNSDLIVRSMVADKDLIFKGNDSDGGGVITALTLDMSDAGAATFNAGISLGNSLAGNGAPFTISNTNNGNNIDIKTTSSGSLVHAVKIHSGGVFEAKQGAVFNEDGNNVDFRIESNGNINMFWVDASSNAIAIGSDNLLTTLHVDAADNEITMNVSSGLSSSSNWNGIGFGARNSMKSAILHQRTTSYSRGSLLFCVNSDADTSHADINDVALTIDNTKKVGIGTTSPGQLLTVEGAGAQIEFRNTTNSLHTFTFVNSSATASYNDIASVGAEIDSGNAKGRLVFRTRTTDASGAQAEHMRIQSDGIVVISSGAETFVPTIKHGGATGDLSKLRVINRSGQSSNKGGLIELGGVTDDGVSRSDVFGAIAGLKNNASSGNREGYLQFSTNDGDSVDEYMRLTSGGILCVGDTTGYSGGHDAVSRLQLTGGGSVLAIRQSQVTDSSHRVVQVFTDANGTYRGRITINNSSCSFTAASDYRLKENIETLPNGLDRLKQLKPVKFKWKEHDYTSEGFIAHEVQEIYPDAVVGEKDDKVMQSMDYGKITPLLVKAIQEQQTIIDDLKARIETLEG